MSQSGERAVSFNARERAIVIDGVPHVFALPTLDCAVRILCIVAEFDHHHPTADPSLVDSPSFDFACNSFAAITKMVHVALSPTHPEMTEAAVAGWLRHARPRVVNAIAREIVTLSVLAQLDNAAQH